MDLVLLIESLYENNETHMLNSQEKQNLWVNMLRILESVTDVSKTDKSDLDALFLSAESREQAAYVGFLKQQFNSRGVVLKEHLSEQQLIEAGLGLLLLLAIHTEQEQQKQATTERHCLKSVKGIHKVLNYDFFSPQTTPYDSNHKNTTPFTPKSSPPTRDGSPFNQQQQQQQSQRYEDVFVERSANNTLISRLLSQEFILHTCILFSRLAECIQTTADQYLKIFSPSLNHYFLNIISQKPQEHLNFCLIRNINCRSKSQQECLSYRDDEQIDEFEFKNQNSKRVCIHKTNLHGSNEGYDEESKSYKQRQAQSRDRYQRREHSLPANWNINSQEICRNSKNSKKDPKNQKKRNQTTTWELRSNEWVSNQSSHDQEQVPYCMKTQKQCPKTVLTQGQSQKNKIRTAAPLTTPEAMRLIEEKESAELDNSGNNLYGQWCLHREETASTGMNNMISSDVQEFRVDNNLFNKKPSTHNSSLTRHSLDCYEKENHLITAQFHRKNESCMPCGKELFDDSKVIFKQLASEKRQYQQYSLEQNAQIQALNAMYTQLKDKYDALLLIDSSQNQDNHMENQNVRRQKNDEEKGSSCLPSNNSNSQSVYFSLNNQSTVQSYTVNESNALLLRPLHEKKLFISEVDPQVNQSSSFGRDSDYQRRAFHTELISQGFSEDDSNISDTQLSLAKVDNVTEPSSEREHLKHTKGDISENSCDFFKVVSLKGDFSNQRSSPRVKKSKKVQPSSEPYTPTEILLLIFSIFVIGTLSILFTFY